jgi:hypothetical protein
MVRSSVTRCTPVVNESSQSFYSVTVRRDDGSHCCRVDRSFVVLAKRGVLHVIAKPF